jgi:hypothetical protein
MMDNSEVLSWNMHFLGGDGETGWAVSVMVASWFVFIDGLLAASQQHSHPLPAQGELYSLYTSLALGPHRGSDECSAWRIMRTLRMTYTPSNGTIVAAAGLAK